MNLYEFVVIAQQGLLPQEIEGMIQELAVLLKNIKAEVILQEAKHIIGMVNNHLTKQELEVRAKKIQEISLNYSNVLENITKVLWNELELDISNLKGIKAKIDKELLALGITKKQQLSGHEQRNKVSFIHNTINLLGDRIAESILENLQDVSQNQALLNKMLESFLRSIKAIGLIKYEYWGLLDFAYTINKVKSGHYFILCISATPGILDEFERKVKLNENVIRSLAIHVNKVFEGESRMMSKQVVEEQA